MSHSTEILNGINHAIEIVSRLREVSRSPGAAELGVLLDDLSGELADTKAQIATLGKQIEKLSAENAALKTPKAPGGQKPEIKSGCYQFADEAGLYCIACYDGRGIKSATKRVHSRLRACPACGSAIPTS